MILIVGGAFQGKCDLAWKLSGMEREVFEKNRGDGERDMPEVACEREFLTGCHRWIRQVMEKGESPKEFVDQVLAAGPRIVTMDEIGCGVVPISRQEREYREAAGYAGQRLAACASQVYRVICNLSVQIK